MKPIKYEDILHSTYLEYCLFCDENFNTMGILNKILNISNIPSIILRIHIIINIMNS